MLFSRSALQEPTPLDRRVAAALVELAPQARKGMIPTAEITSRLNCDLPPEYHVSASAVGKTYRRLGISVTRTNKERGALISPEAIQALADKFALGKPVTSVTSVTTDENKTQLQLVASDGQGVTDSDTYKEASRLDIPCNSSMLNRDCDGSDACDGFLGNGS